jgi:hypothetical protein
MKILALLLAGLAAGATASAGPLKKEDIAANASWLIHLDVENLLATQLGGFVGREILDKKLAKPARQLKEQFGIDLDWRDIQSLTAYGDDLPKDAKRTGVLIVKTEFDLAGTLDALIETISAQTPDAKALVRKVQAEPFAIYAANNDVFGAPAGRGTFLVSKSKEQLEQARQVLNGQDRGLSGASSFRSLAETANGFLVAAVADVFGLGSKLPPLAKGLRDAEAGQVVAGEKDERVFLDLALDTKDAASATQIQQVVQGLIAMAALSQAESPDLQKLVQGARVEGRDKRVTLRVDVALADVIEKVGQRRKQRRP